MMREGQVQGGGSSRVRVTALGPTPPEPPDRSSLRGTRVLVVGLGRSGTSVALFLLRSGAKVVGFDENPEALGSPAVVRLKKAGMTVTRRPETASVDWAVVSPGISNNRPLVQILRRRPVPVIDELDLASRFVGGPLVAVTGTNG